ncbi:MAG: hypothetical protein IJ760_02615 [Bacteroidales bacterium]|nr:hypothetical protein [Bacteroidales bacterium]
MFFDLISKNNRRTIGEQSKNRRSWHGLGGIPAQGGGRAYGTCNRQHSKPLTHTAARHSL